MIEFWANLMWMSLAGVLPVIFFAIDDIHPERRKYRAFKRFIYGKRFVLVAMLAFYAICSVFIAHYGFDILTSLTLLTPIPAFSTFGVGLGIGIGAMLKDGER